MFRFVIVPLETCDLTGKILRADLHDTTLSHATSDKLTTGLRHDLRRPDYVSRVGSVSRAGVSLPGGSRHVCETQ